MFDLKGRVAIVTGGNGGIGLAWARDNVQVNAASPRRERGAPTRRSR